MAGPLAGGRAEIGTAAVHEARVETRSAAETIALGARLGRIGRPGDLICLWGDLGAGKTQVAKGVAIGLGIDATITSPTFILMAEHPGRIPLFHVDLYRLVGPADALAGGVIDDRQADGLTVVEWPDRMAGLLPAARLDVRIEGSGEERRAITVLATAEPYHRYLEAVR
jgi:tRNA threonylcarbamoyladenosine biosynthesis protein TsaE